MKKQVQKTLKKEVKEIKKEIKNSAKGGEMVLYKAPKPSKMGYSQDLAKPTKQFGMQFTPSKIQTEFKTYYERSSRSGRTVARGADLIGIAKVPPDSVGGTVLEISGYQGPIIIGPLAPNFVGTRLYFEALRFEKYKFTKLQFVFLPDVGTSANGSIILGYDPDPSDDFIELNPKIETSLTSIQTLLGYQDSLKASVWSPSVLNCGSVKTDPQTCWYTNYTGGDLRLAAQGALWVCSGGSLADETYIGSIGVEYEIEFWDASLDQLNSMIQFEKPGLTKDTAPNQGFNQLATGTKKSTGGGEEIYPLKQDESGNTYISVPPGVHKFSQTSTCNSGGTPTAPQHQYNFIENIDGINEAVVSILDYVSSGASPTSVATSELKIVAPPGGGKLYGTLDNTFTGTSLSTVIKILEFAAAAVL